MPRGKLSTGSQASRQIRVGALLIVGLFVLAYAIFQVGRLFDVFASRYQLVTLVESVAGMIEGAPVTLAGQRIGQVDDIRFIPLEERTGEYNLRVTLSVNEDVANQIRGDSKARLQTQGLLGDRYVDIVPGSQAFPALRPGDTIASLRSRDLEAVLATAAETMEEVQRVAADLRITTGRLVRGEGTLGALLADDRLYERMTGASTELAVLLQRINRSQGTLARLIDDPALYSRLTAAVARVDSLGGLILNGQGSLGRLVRDDAFYSGLVNVVTRADSTMRGFGSFVEGLNRGDGTLARLIEDPALYDQFLKAVVDIQTLIGAIRADPRSFRPSVTLDVFD